jgi:hypothetical protein
MYESTTDNIYGRYGPSVGTYNNNNNNTLFIATHHLHDFGNEQKKKKLHLFHYITNHNLSFHLSYILNFVSPAIAGGHIGVLLSGLVGVIGGGVVRSSQNFHNHET